MLQFRILGIPCALIAAWGAMALEAAEIGWLFDDFDNPLAVAAIRDQKAVKEFRYKLEAFREKLSGMKRRDIEQLLGEPTAMPLKTYAMPVAQLRQIHLPGLGPKRSKRHKEFYPIKDVGGLEVWYGSDGQSPILVVIRLKVDNSLPKWTQENVEPRLTWDREKFDKLAKYVEERSNRDHK